MLNHTDPIPRPAGFKRASPSTSLRRSSLISRFWSRRTAFQDATIWARLTIRRRGGGHKRHYRLIDFKRDKTGIPAQVATIEYDPNRSAFICLLNYADGEKRYILYPLGLKVGDRVVSGPDADIVTGQRPSPEEHSSRHA